MLDKEEAKLFMTTVLLLSPGLSNVISIQNIFGRKEEGKEKENQRVKTVLEFALNYQDRLFYMFLPRQPPEDLPEAIH